ncbi:MAG: glycosyltransferase [Fibrobacterota bacterium]
MAYLFLLAGYFRSTKGYSRALQAFGKLPKGRAELWIVGDYKKTERNLEFKRDLLADIRNCRGKVRLFRRIYSSERYHRFFEEADCVLLPYEAGPHEDILNDAVLHGNKPVIASDLPGFVRYAQKSKSAVIVHDDAELLAAMLNPIS